MNLTLYYNVISPYSQKTLLAFYEKGVDFTPVKVNVFDPQGSADYKRIYPLGKIPLLTADGVLIPESSIIIEFLENEFPNRGTQLIPTEKVAARLVRFKDRVTDLYVTDPIGIILSDSMMPAEKKNPNAVTKAHATLDITFADMDKALANNPDTGGSSFNMSDCAAFAPLLYAQKLHPYHDFKNIGAYFGRLVARPSAQRLMQELGPALEQMGK